MMILSVYYVHLIEFVTITRDGSILASPVVEFQPGETEKQITITVINIARIELYLSTREGVYLIPFPKTEIVNLNPGSYSTIIVTTEY